MGLPREPYVMRPGFEVLSEAETQDVDRLRRDAHEFYQFYGRHRIYFNAGVCDLLDRFGRLSFFIPSNYHNVVYKDKDGKLYVSPKVKEAWDGAVATIPEF